MQPFGERLRLVRQHRGLTQHTLAHRLGLASHSHVSHLESGRKSPSLMVLLQIAHILHISPDYLVRSHHPSEPVPAPTTTDDLSPDHLPARLRRVRQDRGVTQDDLAARLTGYTQPMLSMLERGVTLPSVEVLVLLADQLDVSVDELLAPL